MPDESSLAQLMAVFSAMKTILRILSWSISDLENKLDAISEELNPSNKSTAETSSAETKSIPIRDVKIETIMAIQNEKEEQKTALEQIEDCAEETRSCIECSALVTVKCFRQKHFRWCTTHERMADETGTCPEYPTATMTCYDIECDKSENEAYWNEVQENAILSGPGFRN